MRVPLNRNPAGAGLMRGRLRLEREQAFSTPSPFCTSRTS